MTTNIMLRHPFVRSTGLLQIAPDYPWKLHCLLLAPLVFFICVTGALHGFWGEETRLWYESLRVSFPGATPYVRVVTDYTAPAIYLYYAALLACGLSRHDRRQILFVLRFIVVAWPDSWR